MPNVSDVRVGAPEQSTTGAIKHAPLGTTLPTLESISTSGVVLDNAFTGNEYVSEDGLTLSPSMSTSDIKDWSGAVVRKLLESFDGTLSWTMISTDENALKISFGDDYVTKNAATISHGTQLRAALGAHLPIVVPDGQITEVGDVTFKANEAVGWNVTLSCYPDSSGHSIYIMTDDGVISQ